MPAFTLSAASLISAMKANNDLVGGPVKPLKLEKHEGQSDIKGNIHQIFKVSEHSDSLSCYLLHAAAVDTDL